MNEKLIAALNSLLADEWAAIHQYEAHAAIDRNWQYVKLDAYIAEHIEDERKHARALMDRIRDLGGAVVADALGAVDVSDDVAQQLANDAGGEVRAILNYNSTIKMALDFADNATRDILAANLADETDHLRDIAAKQVQISQMGIDNFLSAQLG